MQTGCVSVGDEVVFIPSKKVTKIKSIEGFNKAKQTMAAAGESVGFTVTTELYLKPGEVMCAAVDKSIKKVLKRLLYKFQNILSDKNII